MHRVFYTKIDVGNYMEVLVKTSGDMLITVL